MKVSIRKQNMKKRKQGKDNLKLLVESFTCGEKRRQQILSHLKISENKWQLYSLNYKNIFIDSVKKFKTLQFAVDALKKREFSILKSCLKGWVHSKKCRANVTIFREAKKCIGLCRLHYLQEHWEPSENIKWFEEHIWCGKKRPNKKFRLLYEWVEDEIDARKSILVSEVREHAGLLLGEEFGKYKKIERLGQRMKTFFNLEAVRMGGRKLKWVAKK